MFYCKPTQCVCIYRIFKFYLFVVFTNFASSPSSVIMIAFHLDFNQFLLRYSHYLKLQLLRNKPFGQLNAPLSIRLSPVPFVTVLYCKGRTCRFITIFVLSDMRLDNQANQTEKTDSSSIKKKIFLLLLLNPKCRKLGFCKCSRIIKKY
jgi:hypothetical protein